MANGILIIDKPSGWTSQDVAAKLRGLYHEKRVGHGGTLDPMATGVLPVFVGRATRAAEFFEHAEKEYIAVLRLGTVTDTQDISGTVLSERPVNVPDSELLAALQKFTGEQSQLPPMYSAVKINGQKLYELARKGKTVERSPRRITVFEAELLGREGNDCRIRFRVSKGTYVRTLCADIGEALGCGGCMAALRRSAAGVYTLADARTMEEVAAAQDREALLLPVDSMFSRFPALTVSGKPEKRLRDGAEASVPGTEDGKYRVYGASGCFLLLGECRNGQLKTIKSFFEVKSD